MFSVCVYFVCLFCFFLQRIGITGEKLKGNLTSSNITVS